jgi:hypothetical protein
LSDGIANVTTGPTDAQRAAARRTAWILAAVALAVIVGFIALQGWLR